MEYRFASIYSNFFFLNEIHSKVCGIHTRKTILLSTLKLLTHPYYDLSCVSLKLKVFSQVFILFLHVLNWFCMDIFGQNFMLKLYIRILNHDYIIY